MQNQAMGLKHWAAFITLVLSAGTSFLWIKLGLRELQPANLLLWRLLFATTTLALMALLLRAPRPRTAADWAAVFSVGLGNVALPQMLIFLSQQSVDTTVTGVLVATTPFHTLLTAHLILRDEAITLRKLLAMLLAFGGVVVLLSRALSGAEGAGFAVLLPLGAAFCYATSSVLARRFGGGLHPLSMALYGTIVATLAIAPLVLLRPGAAVVPQAPLTWFAISMVGVMGGGLTYVLFLFLVGSVGPTRTQMTSFVFPLVTTVTGVLVLGEQLSGQLLLGGLLILAGIWLFHRRGRVPIAPAAPSAAGAPVPPAPASARSKSA